MRRCTFGRCVGTECGTSSHSSRAKIASCSAMTKLHGAGVRHSAESARPGQFLQRSIGKDLRVINVPLAISNIVASYSGIATARWPPRAGDERVRLAASETVSGDHRFDLFATQRLWRLLPSPSSPDQQPHERTPCNPIQPNSRNRRPTRPRPRCDSSMSPWHGRFATPQRPASSAI